MYLLLDTETTGLIRNKETNEIIPHLIQLAFILCDNNGTILEQNDFIIQPKGFTISENSTSIHGISTERAIKEGVPLEFALNSFEITLQKAEYIVAHNLYFVEKIMDFSFRCEKKTNPLLYKKRICTLNNVKTIDPFPLNLFTKNQKYNLSGLYRKLFGKNLKNAHNALADTFALYECFFLLKSINLIKCN